MRRGPSRDKIVVGLFTAATVVLLAGVGGRPASWMFLAAAALTGLVLVVNAPVTYASFSLWLWWITPFVRRVLDHRHGWNPTNPVLLAPPLVALFSVLVILRHPRELRGILYAPYLLVVGALAYGYAVGMLTAGPFAATYALVTWLAPVLFGIHLAVSWRIYPELGASLRRAFSVALPLLAAYGLYQFVRLPSWDAQWMRNADLKSLGNPAPFLVRIFGTLNTPGPYAAFLVAGLLMLLQAKGRWRYISTALAIVALLLTRTRAAWAAFIIGILVQYLSAPIVRLPKRAVTLVVVSLLALPLATIPKFRNIIAPRLSTLTNLRSDNSFIKRVQFSAGTATGIVGTAEGSGLGTTGGAIKLRGEQGVRSLDNGFLEVFFIYGWPGGALFFLGIAGLLLQAFRFAEARRDMFANSVRATAVALASILPIGDVFTGPTGTLLWSMVGLGIAAHAYHMTTGLALRSQWAVRILETPPPPPVLPEPGLAHVAGLTQQPAS
ncbi:MAG: O-antigen ligase family protein [Gemmatimonadales bacterium]